MLGKAISQQTQPVMPLSIAKPKEQWSRLPNEPSLAFMRFGSYLMLPPNARSLLGAYKVFMRRTKPDKAATMNFSRAPDSWYDAMEKYDWERRAIAYDIAQHEQYVAGVEEQRQAVVEELKADSLIIWRKMMETIRIKMADSMSLQGATYAGPRIWNMIKELWGLDQQQALSLDVIMAALPAHLRSEVLSIIRIGQVNITVNQTSDGNVLPPPSEVIEGEVIEGE